MTENETIVSATVFRDGDGWHIRFWNSAGEEVAVEPVRWDGAGSFYDEGLNYVVGPIQRRGLVYAGSAAWDEAEDGSFSAVMHQPDPRFN